MLKEGKYRAFRNIPIGWVLQALHSTDRSERLFRVCIEVVIWLAIYVAVKSFAPAMDAGLALLTAFAISHTLMWLLTGNFWVYMLDSFLWVRNPGIDGVVQFTQFTRSVFTTVDCVDAILIYGSMCRGQLHGRSDLDLRVVRRTDSWKGLIALPLGFLVRMYSFFVYMPVDLEVVDSMAFVRKQMRDDERPIGVFIRPGVCIDELGMDFSEVEKEPSIVLKESV